MVKWIKRLLLLALILLIAGIATVTVIYYQLKSDLPDVTSIQDIPLQVPMKVFSKDGELISQFGEKRRIPLLRKDIPDQLVNAFIATEDSRFYQHVGMDPIGIMRAASVYILSGSAKQGASTITQQVARNFFLTNERTILRKVREIFIAIQIEQLLTKDEILMLYLNKISLGHRSFGVGAAAQVYFGKTVSELTLSEMAVLAGLPKAPSRVNPIYSVERATERRNVVLGRMLDEGYITQEEYEQAKSEKILSHYHGAEITLSAHYVAELARHKLIELYGEERSYSEGFNVYTTITKKTQEAANKAVIDNVYGYDTRHGYRGATKVLWDPKETPWSTEKIIKTLDKAAGLADLKPAVVVAVNDKSIDVIIKGNKETVSTIDWDGLSWARPFKSDSRQGYAPKKALDIVQVGEQILTRAIPVETKDAQGKVTTTQQLQLSQYPEVSSAFVALNPQDGAVTAMVGGFNFAQSEFNRATQAKRQVGSNIKPFIYSAALDNGYTLATLVNDTPISQWSGSDAWRPKNSPEVYAGPIRLRQALGQSKNVVSVRLLDDVGLEKVTEQLAKFGFDPDDMPQSNSLALGSASASPLTVATGYAIIANGGYKIDPYIIERIEDAYGNVLYQAQPKIVCPECVTTYEAQQTATQTNPLATMTLTDGGAKVCAISPINRDQIAPSAIAPETAFLTRELLRTAVWGGGTRRSNTYWSGTGWRAARAIGRQDMGGKTGTTNNSKDAWFSGFVGNMVATSWVGFDDFNRELGRAVYNSNLGKNQVAGGEFGARTALPAWISYMKATMSDQPVYNPKRPSTISKVRIDRKTGLLAGSGSSGAFYEYFTKGTAPTHSVPAPMIQGKGLQRGGSSNLLYDDELF
ncbi:PBP1A family penicillin-binding protein [Psychromonas aquatilis]|uniref:Penicillin-binding protein 1A n=1 Tax=Psychromonas aquatilis TaxID=2005072 RepID=A0ABU9GM42_9GAMM